MFCLFVVFFFILLLSLYGDITLLKVIKSVLIMYYDRELRVGGLFSDVTRLGGGLIHLRFAL